ncbi:hypothetical protein O6P43_022888 [Quillaja saponaria]|uniref:Uncharacterized protein n=1 Tax=Quillaja saponaria TaxID=32244 RepID=A0AAD7PIJ5_QUISA|nr:hypothetical protein O6P43_022888 [Quillaja saponaria]
MGTDGARTHSFRPDRVLLDYAPVSEVAFCLFASVFGNTILSLKIERSYYQMKPFSTSISEIKLDFRRDRCVFFS